MLDNTKTVADSNNNQIMHHIQNQIHKAATLHQQPPPRTAKLTYPHKPFDIPYNLTLYQQLDEAKNRYTNYSRELDVQQNRLTRIPLLGKIAYMIQTQLHQIALFYTNRAIRHQLKINQHLIESIAQLTIETQKQQRTITELQAQLTILPDSL